MMTGDSLSTSFGNLVASANNDCPDPAAPPGVISLTITGIESGGHGLVTLCVSRPDLLTTKTAVLGSPGVQLIDLSASDATCTYTVDAAPAPSGTVSSTGMCANGTDPHGFGLTVQASASLRRNCGTNADTIAVQLQGDVAVEAM